MDKIIFSYFSFSLVHILSKLNADCEYRKNNWQASNYDAIFGKKNWILGGNLTKTQISPPI